MMTNMSSTYGTKPGVMILIPIIPKHPETRYGVLHLQYAHPKEKLREETLTSCHSHVREKTIQKFKCIFRKNRKHFQMKVKCFTMEVSSTLSRKRLGNFFFVLIDLKEHPYHKLVITMEHFRHFGDIVVKLMDTAKKTTYHPAKNVRSTVCTRLFLENTLNLMRRIFM